MVEILKVVHVALAVFAVGTNLSFPVWIRAAERDPWNLAFTLRTIRFIDRRVTIPAYLLVALSGVALVFAEGVPFATIWVAAAVGLFLAVIGVGVLFYGPVSRRRLAAAEHGGAADPAYREQRWRAMVLDLVIMPAVVTIVALMVFKPA